MEASKPLVLFYSKYCNFSREVRDMVSKSPLKNKTIYICVDDKPKNMLPATVKRVPTLIDRQSGDVFVGESITGIFGQMAVGPTSNGFPRESPGHPGMQNTPMSAVPTSLPGGFQNSQIDSTGPAAQNMDSGPYALMAGQALNTLDESYLPLSGVLETAGAQFSSKTGKGDGIESKYEQLMAERNLEGKGPRRM